MCRNAFHCGVNGRRVMKDGCIPSMNAPSGCFIGHFCLCIPARPFDANGDWMAWCMPSDLAEGGGSVRITTLRRPRRSPLVSFNGKESEESVCGGVSPREEGRSSAEGRVYLSRPRQCEDEETLCQCRHQDLSPNLLDVPGTKRLLFPHD